MGSRELGGGDGPARLLRVPPAEDAIVWDGYYLGTGGDIGCRNARVAVCGVRKGHQRGYGGVRRDPGRRRCRH